MGYDVECERDRTRAGGFGTLEEPKYRQIYSALRQSIAKGIYKAGQRLPSEAELVEQFESSRLTVAKALRELQDEGIIVRKAGSGSYVQAESDGKKLVFGLLIPELGRTEIFEPICQSIAHTRPEREHSLMWGNVSPNSSAEDQARTLARQYLSQKVAGVFFAPLELPPSKEDVNRNIVEMFASAHIPLVLLDRDVSKYPLRSELDLIGIDNHRAGFVLTEHLIQQGCERIHFVGLPNSASTIEARIAGYRDALLFYGKKLCQDHIWRIQPTEIASVHDLYQKGKPDGIVCGNDFTAASLMASLVNLGAKIPKDICLVGVDDVTYASLLQVPLTTIHQPCHELGSAAVSAMFERVRYPDIPAREILLNFDLIVRKSSAREI